MVRLTLIEYVFQRIMLAGEAIFLTCDAITNTHSTSVSNSNKCNSRCDNYVTYLREVSRDVLPCKTVPG